MVADMIPVGAVLADVGTDHAYLPAALVLEGKIGGAIAADLRQGPLSRAKETVREYGLNGKIAFRLCDGLSGIRPEEVNAVSIAGMGGETIAMILEAAPWTREQNTALVLQPMSSMDELRRWCKHGKMNYTGMLTLRDLGGEVPFMTEAYEEQTRAFARMLVEPMGE
jgi:tRNA (adenine22-N1)-methyltransferase